MKVVIWDGDDGLEVSCSNIFNFCGEGVLATNREGEKLKND